MLDQSVFDATNCLLCGEPFDPLYKHVGVLAGICAECGPPAHRAWEKPKLGKNRAKQPPAGFQLLKSCRCGRIIASGGRKCFRCARLARSETYRKANARR